jgi:two-component system response regulator YesN
LVNSSKKRIFTRLFISYFLIITIPLAACSIVYYESVKVGTEDAKTENVLMLSQVKDILDARLGEIQSVSNQIVMDKRVISVLNAGHYEDGSADFYRIWDLCNNMPNYKLTNQLILELYIFLKSSDIVINSDSAYCSTDTLYGKAFSFGNLNYSDWNGLIWKEFYNSAYFPSTQIKINDKNYSAICFMQSLPYDSASNAQGVLTIFINEGAIKSMLQRFDIGSTGMVFIADSKGKLISFLAGKNCRMTAAEIQASIGKGNGHLPANTVISTVKSESNGWKYVSVIPEDLVLSKVKYIKSITLIMFLLSLAAGGLAAFLLTYRKANILAKVTEKFDALSGTDLKKGKHSDTFEFIDNAVSEMIHNISELENRAKEQVPLLEAAMLRRLLYGEISEGTDDNAVDIFKDVENDIILVINLCVEAVNKADENDLLSDYSKTNVFIKEIVNQSSLPKHYLLDISRKTIAILVIANNVQEETLKSKLHKTLEEIRVRLEVSLKIYVNFAVSETHNGVRSANIAFEESNSVVDYMRYIKKPNVIWYSEIPKDSGFYYYPVDVELRLIGLVKSGDTSNVKKALENIYMENFEKRQLSSEMLQQLIYSMKGTVTRGLGSMSYNQNVREAIEDLYRASTIDEIFNCVIRANVDISIAMNDLKIKSQNNIKEIVVEYVEKHYNQSELTLEKLADSLGHSESFMYQFFKDNFGESFADYLESRRIGLACECLAETGVIVKNVASKVGYNSDNSFRRAFKRIVGVSPSQYAQATTYSPK